MCFRKHLAELFFALATQMAALPSMLPSHSQNAGGMLTQAEEGMKLFEAQQGTAAEVGIPQVTCGEIGWPRCSQMNWNHYPLVN